MNRTRYIFFSVLLFLIGAGVLSCKKEVADPNSSNPNVLPPLTHEGKNTFGCKVNGEVWVAYAPYSISGPIALEGNYDPSTGNFLLEGNKDYSDVFERIRIGCHDVYNEGIYYVPSEENENIIGFRGYTTNQSCSKYYYRSELLRKVEVTYLDPVKRIISGTFEMDLINPSCPGDTVKIREGRFDWRY